jgi:hypothetical protein
VLAAVVAVAVTRRTASESGSVPLAAAGTELSLQGDEPTLLFRHTSAGDNHGALASVPMDEPTGARVMSDLACDRVHFRHGRGVCLQAHHGVVPSSDAIVFDADLQTTHRIELAGVPSRVKVSSTGAMAAVTMFVTGHSYAQTGFSTQTQILDLDQGVPIADLEDFVVLRDGEPWWEVDFNFWGVTFADEQTFYATLGTGGKTFLVKGDLVDQQLEIFQEGSECPSLSPDGNHVAVKKRVDSGLGPVEWNLAVIDLRTGVETPLAETRNVDDQIEWLDDNTVLYGLPNEQNPATIDTWALPADGSGAPRMLVAGGYSTTVITPRSDAP